MAGTATTAFGAGRRENHDASDFYARFTPPLITTDATVNPPARTDVIITGDAAAMSHRDVADNSVALLVTSPPYFVGKAYEQDLGSGHVPVSYFDYLERLRDVLAVSARKLEPGGRMAINVANLGRKPYRSLAADVIGILQDDLGLLLRGEIIWQKGRGAGGSCAWGSFQSPVNPVLRDVTERVIVASKGRFDRAVPRRERHRRDLPAAASISRDEFLEATTDVWEIPPEFATRVNHPAPFPVALPQRLIELYTYEGDLVLDPYMGSGSTAVAAVRTGRHYVGFEVDDEYVATADRRIAEERIGRAPMPEPTVDDPVAAARHRGLLAVDVAAAALRAAGFTDITANPRVGPGATVSLAASRGATRWFVEVVGGFTTVKSGLGRVENVWRTIAKASLLALRHPDAALLVLTTDAPAPGTPVAAALAEVTGHTIDAIVDLSDPDCARRIEAVTAR